MLAKPPLRRTTLAALVQHADALMLIDHLEARILANPAFYMSYSDAAAVLQRSSAKNGRHIGQVTSRIDAACFYAKTPFLAMHRVRQTHGDKINPRSFQGALWQSYSLGLVARADSHTWSAGDFVSIKRALRSLGDDAANLLWERIEQFGQKAVIQALGGPPALK